MKILVCAKRAIDYNVKIRVKTDGSGVEKANVKMSLNPFDEIAVEESLRLREKGIATEVIAVSVGPKVTQETLRAAMALGVDRGILVETEDDLEPRTIAKIFQKLVEKESPGLVILGKQAIDGDNNQVGQMLAAFLNWGQGTFISSLDIQGAKAHISREVDGGIEHLSLKLPCVLTTDLRLNTPRYATLPNIMKAKSKPLETILATSLGLDLAQKLTTQRVDEPKKRTGGVKVADVQELFHKLKDEAKVI